MQVLDKFIKHTIIEQVAPRVVHTVKGTTQHLHALLRLTTLKDAYPWDTQLLLKYPDISLKLIYDVSNRKTPSLFMDMERIQRANIKEVNALLLVSIVVPDNNAVPRVVSILNKIIEECDSRYKAEAYTDKLLLSQVRYFVEDFHKELIALNTDGDPAHIFHSSYFSKLSVFSKFSVIKSVNFDIENNTFCCHYDICIPQESLELSFKRGAQSNGSAIWALGVLALEGVSKPTKKEYIRFSRCMPHTESTSFIHNWFMSALRHQSGDIEFLDEFNAVKQFSLVSGNEGSSIFMCGVSMPDQLKAVSVFTTQTLMLHPELKLELLDTKFSAAPSLKQVFNSIPVSFQSLNLIGRWLTLVLQSQFGQLSSSQLSGISQFLLADVRGTHFDVDSFYSSLSSIGELSDFLKLGANQSTTFSEMLHTFFNCLFSEHYLTLALTSEQGLRIHSLCLLLRLMAPMLSGDCSKILVVVDYDITGIFYDELTLLRDIIHLSNAKKISIIFTSHSPISVLFSNDAKLLTIFDTTLAFKQVSLELDSVGLSKYNSLLTSVPDGERAKLYFLNITKNLSGVELSSILV